MYSFKEKVRMVEAAKRAAQVRSTEEIRSHFPALGRRQGAFSVAYFDGPGGTQVPRSVAEAMSDYLLHHNANRHWAFATSAETDQAIDDARAALADFLNADAREIVFGANMTTLVFHLSRALGRHWQAGDEVVVTELDHHANIAPWQALARERGITLRMVRMIPETGQLDWKDFERQVNRKTRLVAVAAASNALGTINNISRAAGIAHRAGAWLLVDAVHYAPHELTDVRAMDCEFLVCSAYKFYGPHVGVLFGKLDLLQSIDFPKLAPAPDSAPERAETGTQNHEGIVGAAAAVDFIASLAAGSTRRERLSAVFGEFHKRGQQLVRKLWEGLAAIPAAKLYGPPPDAPRTPTVSFTIQGVPAEEAARKLGEQGLFLSHGDFYARTVVERLGLAPGGLLRAGCACYTTEGEVQRLIKAVRELM
jgi:cysteine desulfurase family protein (TIGR01976 family)